MEVTVPQ